jgi:hypothetical protein
MNPPITFNPRKAAPVANRPPARARHPRHGHGIARADTGYRGPLAAQSTAGCVMARIRSVKPEFWDDRKLARLACRDARLLYIGLWNQADEWQRVNGDPQWIKGQVFPYDDDIDATRVGELLAELENPALGAVMAYEADGDPYLFLPKLDRHQRLEPEKVKSRLPAPPASCVPAGPDEPDPAPAGAAPELQPASSRADSSEPRADKTARDAHDPAPRARQSPLLYVAGSREHVAGSRAARAHAIPNAPPPSGPTEIPDDFAPTDAMRRWANSTYPGLDLDFETEQFRRYWRSEGRKKKSWVDAWQKWIADSHRRLTGRASPPPGDRRQQTTDDLFDDAMRRAEVREGIT